MPFLCHSHISLSFANAQHLLYSFEHDMCLNMCLNLCRAFGQPSEGISIGPVKFSRTAELLNGRAAMVG